MNRITMNRRGTTVSCMRRWRIKRRRRMVSSRMIQAMIRSRVSMKRKRMAGEG